MQFPLNFQTFHFTCGAIVLHFTFVTIQQKTQHTNIQKKYGETEKKNLTKIHF